jgi:hypothetical protein
MTSNPNRYDEEFGGTASDLDVLLCLDDDEELTAAQLAALARLDDGPLDPAEDDDPCGAGFGPGTCPPEGWDLMTDAERQAVLDTLPAAAVPEVLDAGFTHRDGGDGRGRRRAGAAGSGTAGAPAAGASAPGWSAGLAGSVNLTMPAPSWLGQSDKPGQISGLGAADAGTCRDVADTLARHPATRWCVTLLGPDGRPAAHGCARAGPGPPGTDRKDWLAQVKITPIETGTCTHRRESAGYQPADSLRHITKIRSPRCGAPGCRRPEPGQLIWTTPSGRQYTVTAGPYPV